jgi:hypothetical protein
MRDYLLDLVEHTYDLGCIDLIKITGDDKETRIDGIADDRSVIVQGKFAKANADFMGTFGMPNLGKLKILLNLAEYKENAKINLTTMDRNGESVPNGLHFENKVGDFKNDYRFMVKEIIDDKLKAVTFKGAKWDIEFEPTMASIQRLKMMASANSEESNFRVKVEDNNLKFYFGDHSTHAGNFVFQTDVAGTIKHEWAYPVSQIIRIMDLTGDKTMRISDQGVAEITVDSGVATYTYLLPAQSK